MSGAERTRRETLPCLTAEAIDDMVAGKPVEGLPATSASDSGPLSPHEKLVFHFFAFLIVTWNLGMVNLAHSLGHLWFWPPVAVWAGVLLVHLGIVSMKTRQGRAKGMEGA